MFKIICCKCGNEDKYNDGEELSAALGQKERITISATDDNRYYFNAVIECQTCNNIIIQNYKNASDY